ncbi:transcription elongation factor GreAB [Halieaceae bacterium IMCC14734]|uniref:Transcription elongation factor GreAB n=1 Tax=Candidatus Litorirhabdus singularis TaxID=2518993 RepID=A0ABT3TM89_9GAMM|nr:GreA/GreB family elongation factor [Candidatus Litorirhabdus singularis]MCX2983443.1 transcription elongation factor GreAB [Candidatus Litorirhabdus singularis]
MHDLISAIVKKLQLELSTAVTASEQAHDSATHSENIAANKYDTLAVEAAYLAHGQSMRIAELKQSIALYQNFQRPTFNAHATIQTGALVCIEDDEGQQRRFLIGPAAGGLSIDGEQGLIQVVTPTAPLGQALMGKRVDDEVDWEINQRKESSIIVAIE